MASNQSRPFIQYDAVITAPCFSLGVRCHGEEWLQAVDFMPFGLEQKARTYLAREVVQQIHAYLRDSRFCFDLPLQLKGTAFQQRVWELIARIPQGQTTSYGRLAQNMDTAPRAIGQACGANPCPIIVPCHRVIASNGGLGGFNRQAGGFLVTVKRWLLSHEQSDAS